MSSPDSSERLQLFHNLSHTPLLYLQDIEATSPKLPVDQLPFPVVICRLLGGISTAGGSVTLGVLADMWEPEDQEYAIAWLVLSSVGGSVVGAVVGGFVEREFCP